MRLCIGLFFMVLFLDRKNGVASAGELVWRAVARKKRVTGFVELV
jgi:hypothetical protein